MLTAPRHHVRTTLALDPATDLPAGVVGRMTGVALVYEVIDTRGTTFARGALSRTMRERVAAGKVKLFWDHGDAHLTGAYDTDLHIGVVRRMWDERLPDGRMAAMMEADLFDTAEGRRAHEYLRAVQAAGGETGLSIGMMEDTVRTDTVRIDGTQVVRIKECGLEEVSITSMPAVPGTAVTHVRADVKPPPDPPDPPPDPADDPSSIDYEPLLRTIAAHVGLDRFRALAGAVIGDASETTDSDAASSEATASAPSDSDAAPVDSPDAAPAAPAPTYATYAERLLRMRALYAELA
jgi:HK97 family phage prohead protease